MLDFLKRLYKHQLTNLHILVTSRPETDIRHCLDLFKPTRSSFDLQLDPRHLADLAAYIADSLTQPEFEDWHAATREEVRNALSDTDKSQGM